MSGRVRRTIARRTLRGTRRDRETRPPTDRKNDRLFGRQKGMPQDDNIAVGVHPSEYRNNPAFIVRKRIFDRQVCILYFYNIIIII